VVNAKLYLIKTFSLNYLECLFTTFSLISELYNLSYGGMELNVTDSKFCFLILQRNFSFSDCTHYTNNTGSL
jgi:hypothetical protein